VDNRITERPWHGRGGARGGGGSGVYTQPVKSRVVVALLALAAMLAPGGAAGEDPVAALSLIRPKPVKDAPDFEEDHRSRHDEHTNYYEPYGRADEVR